jgi:K+-transporting ATPase ATPase C chain
MKSLKKATLLFGVLFIITGLVYPFAVTLVSESVFPSQAHGSLIMDSNKTIIGSELIGQNFTAPQYFQSRPSSSGNGYDPTASGGSNLGPTNPTLLGSVANRTSALKEAGVTDPIPSDLVMASGSGLDPHISTCTGTCCGESTKYFGRRTTKIGAFRIYRVSIHWNLC